MSRRPLLLVAAGPDAGARLPVTRGPLLVGRAREADLVLTDRGVSRHHLHVAPGATPGSVLVAVRTGAQPFLLGDKEHTEAEARVGDRIVIGNTVLLVTEIDAPPGSIPPPEPTGITTQIDQLLGGLGAEVRGFAALFALNEALLAADDRPAIERALAGWARDHAECDSVEILDASRAPAMAPDALLEQRVGDRMTFLIPIHSGGPIRVAFHTRLSPDRVSDAFRRLLLVAGAVCAASLERVRVRELVEQDRDSLRQLAVGSARGFLGDSPAAQEVERVLPKLAASETTVLLLGESGVGKSFVARLVHELGARAREPLRILNCAAIPESLVESELFGHERGAFSGAVGTREGAFEAAGRGTIFLDEVGELPLSTQAKLLRVIEDRRFERIGSNKSLAVRARILVATNRDLAAMVEDGTFRRDLYYRLSVITVRIPSLRERGDDVLALARQILADLAPSAGRRIDGFSPAAIDSVRSYPWPGNVRELRNCIEHAVVMGDGRSIEPSDFPSPIRAFPPRAPAPVGADERFTVQLPAALDVLERRAIDAALEACGGNRTRAAALLGINRQTLYNKLRDRGDE